MSYSEGCFICGSSAVITLCPACLLIQYCSVAHRDLDAQRHSESCLEVMTEREYLDDLERQREMSHSVYDSALSRKQYEHAHTDLINATFLVNTSISADEAWKLVVNCNSKFLNWIDDPFSDLVVAILIKCNKHQLCYDIFSWWESVDGDWAKDIEELLPHLAIENPPSSDVFEDPAKAMLIRAPGDGRLRFEVPLMLLKITWMHELEDVEAFKTVEDWLRGQLNYDVTEIIRHYITESDVIKSRRRVWEENNSILIERLKRQVTEIFDSLILNRTHVHLIWGILVRKHEGKKASWSISDSGKVTKYHPIIAQALELYLLLWKENSRAVRVIKDLVLENKLAGGVYSTFSLESHDYP